MIGKWRKSLENRRYGLKTVTAVAMSFLTAGVLLTAGFNWTGPSSAQNSEAEKHVSAEPSAPVPAPSLAPLFGQPFGASFAPLTEKLTLSVVNVKVTKIENAAIHGPQGPGEEPYDPYDEFFGNGDRFHRNEGRFPGNGGNQLVQGAGSGVIISSDGSILTNNHVVEGAREVRVILGDKRELSARVVGRDPKTDLAVLKVAAGKDLPAAAMGDSESLKVGDWVLAIGNPFGLGETVTSGIVSAKGRVIGAGPYDDFIQTDASINPGNSGGPLFNMKGEVVGINTAVMAHGQGIGFAIPINTAKPLIPQLVSKGKVTRGYLGVNIQSITPEIASALKLGERKGALVADVFDGSRAERAGIEHGDLIVAYNGKEVKSSQDLATMVASSSVGEEVTVTVLRHDNEKELRIRIARLQPDRADLEELEGQFQEQLGMMLEDVTPRVAREHRIRLEYGAYVADVQPGGPADEAGIQEGDVIVEVNHQPVKSVDEVEEQVAGADDQAPVLFLVHRGRGMIYIALSNRAQNP
ncbi:MAG TPA: DegQ family serine endoprotease [Syntrophobacteraceae bacterium]|nr:DegQ family serine endoprotease [Syntrophobacteraceae bacterium]